MLLSTVRALVRRISSDKRSDRLWIQCSPTSAEQFCFAVLAAQQAQLNHLLRLSMTSVCDTFGLSPSTRFAPPGDAWRAFQRLAVVDTGASSFGASGGAPSHDSNARVASSAVSCGVPSQANHLPG